MQRSNNFNNTTPNNNNSNSNTGFNKRKDEQPDSQYGSRQVAVVQHKKNKGLQEVAEGKNLQKDRRADLSSKESSHHTPWTICWMHHASFIVGSASQPTTQLGSVTGHCS